MTAPIEDPFAGADAAPLPPTRRWLHLLLLGLTVASTFWTGLLQSEAFYFEPLFAGETTAPPPFLKILAGGAGFSLSIIAILGAHELGHYLTARRVGMHVTPPFFLPFPSMFGTLGAFIKMRLERHGTRALDFLKVAAYGPIAGFVVVVPVLFLGVALSRPIEAVAVEGGLLMGEPLLMKLAIVVSHPALAEGLDLYVHPIAFAAWGGLLITALNLFPVGQLDGGHIVYTVLGEDRQRRFGPWLFAAMVALTAFVFSGWLLMCILVWLFGLVHPPACPDVPVGRPGRGIALLCLAIFALSFTPVPFDGTPTLLDLIRP
jgi:hypothetical protein